jgi:hypothetical protein
LARVSHRQCAVDARAPKGWAAVTDSALAESSFEYEVIGEHLLDPRRLLTIDTEGRLFDLDLKTCTALPTELTDAWVVDTVHARRLLPEGDRLLPPPVLVVG